MNLVDIILVVIAITAVLRGYEIGFVRQICSTAGIIIGTAAGVFVQTHLISLVHTPNAKTMMAIVIMTVFVMVFSMGGHLAGDMLRGHIDNSRRKRLIDRIDRISGGVGAFVTLVIVIWLAASLFKNVPDQTTQKQVRGSFVVSKISDLMPPVPSSVAKLGYFLNPNAFPEVFTGLEPRIDTNKPLPSIGDFDAIVTAARNSIVKIEGIGCGGITQGSGFVAEKNLVITNAHVVAGVKQPIIVDGAGQHKASTIYFDPSLDLAILRAEELGGEPLSINTEPQTNGSSGVVLGYPNGGDFTPLPATIIERFSAVGQNIYNQGSVDREVYSVKAAVEHGNSGGPLLGKDGKVMGVMFAESTTYNEIGYALTTPAVKWALDKAKTDTVSIDTGGCAQ